jgi:hypothetical protein
MWVWMVIVIGVIVSLMFAGDYSSDFSGCGGCLLLVLVIILSFVILIR